MKKFLTAILVAAALFTTVGCSGRPATTADVLQSSADAEEGSSHDSQGSLRTGHYAVGSLSSSASAGEEDGLIQTDVTIVAVTVDETGVITDCVIDAVQAKANFDSQGQLLTDLTVPVPSKNELGADYGMVMILPQMTTTKPAPAARRTSRTSMVKPVGAPMSFALSLKLYWVLAMQTGRFP